MIFIANIDEYIYMITDRGRSSSNGGTKMGKRSRSSPPSSRRNTRDSFPHFLPEEDAHCYSEIGSLKSLADLPDKNLSGRVSFSSNYFKLFFLLTPDIYNLSNLKFHVRVC